MIERNLLKQCKLVLDGPLDIGSVNQQQLYVAIRDNNEISPNIIRIVVPYTYLVQAIESLDLSIFLLLGRLLVAI